MGQILQRAALHHLPAGTGGFPCILLGDVCTDRGRRGPRFQGGVWGSLAAGWQHFQHLVRADGLQQRASIE